LFSQRAAFKNRGGSIGNVVFKVCESEGLVIKYFVSPCNQDGSAWGYIIPSGKKKVNLVEGIERLPKGGRKK
jgi:hypothetical protein